MYIYINGLQRYEKSNKPQIPKNDYLVSEYDRNITYLKYKHTQKTLFFIFFQKKSAKNLVVSNKSITFATAFEMIK